MRLNHLPSERLDNHHKAIMEYVKKNPGCSEKQVFDAMDNQGICSKMTTVRKIKELKKMEEIRDSLADGKKGFHKLYINEKNEFNRVNKALLKIERIVDSMSEPSKVIKSMGEPDMIKDVPKRRIVKNLHDNFLGGYEQSIDNMLEALLCVVNKKIHSEKDAWALYSRIIKSKIKLNEQMSIFDAEGIEHRFLSCNSLIMGGLYDLERIEQTDCDYAKKREVPIDKLVLDLKYNIQSFKDEFLQDYP